MQVDDHYPGAEQPDKNPIKPPDYSITESGTTAPMVERLQTRESASPPGTTSDMEGTKPKEMASSIEIDDAKYGVDKPELIKIRAIIIPPAQE